MLKKSFSSSFHQSKIMQQFIKIYLFDFVTFNAQNAQCRQPLLKHCESQFIFDTLSLEKDLSSEQLVTIKLRNIVNISSTLGGAV